MSEPSAERVWSVLLISKVWRLAGGRCWLSGGGRACGGAHAEQLITVSWEGRVLRLAVPAALRTDHQPFVGYKINSWMVKYFCNSITFHSN